MSEQDVEVGGRRLHVWDTGEDGAKLTVVWQHGTPGLGEPPEPLLGPAAHLGIRFVGYDRPGYGRSDRDRGRNVASAALAVAAVLDALGVERFAVMGASGGGPHSLAAAALLPDRVVAAVSIAGLAPFDAAGLDWFGGMYDSGEAELRAACDGPDALRRHLESSDFDPAMFTPADVATLSGEWAWLGRSAGQALQGGFDGMVDDDLAFVTDWGFTPEQVIAPVLLMHGVDDRVVPSSHSSWLADRLPSAHLRTFPSDGHVSVLQHARDALEWLTAL